MTKKRRIIITVILSIIESIGCFSLYEYFTIIDNAIGNLLTHIVPVGALFGLNYYILAPGIYYIFSTLYHFFGHYELISKKFNEIAENCVAWLADIDQRWGVIDIAEECQNANTCEGLLAFINVGSNKRYSSIYRDSFQSIVNELTDKGLASKSLNHETVVCTSMVLYLYALEIKTSDQFLNYKNKFNDIAQNLWSIKSEYGWGVYLEKSNRNNSSIANTFWALRALNEYKDISHTQEYYNMVRRVFEYSNDSVFGYSSADYRRLWPTAMSVILYYNVDETLRNSLKEIYNVKEAINFVYKQFCVKKMEIETETLVGIEEKNKGAKKAPWTHIAIEVSIEALVLAFKNGAISTVKMDLVIERIKKICKTNLVYTDDSRTKCYYIPRDMQKNPNGIYTFPTAYFAWGLSNFDFNEGDKK